MQSSTVKVFDDGMYRIFAGCEDFADGSACVYREFAGAIVIADCEQITCFFGDPFDCDCEQYCREFSGTQLEAIAALESLPADLTASALPAIGFEQI